ncbi:neuronal acetylcholine receptor subunit alpha-7-like [Dendronephthya gigantea]|uniref:neuronal acetylcholine receptor subunit alpha-7-like n=1 Tax=Dendronephthya gigantea TaxID=151771 RepID=UPI00106A1570|nr:neuronal acetylcholine receptor subunit alpha-7-like [Dendronephthya gigantea]
MRHRSIVPGVAFCTLVVMFLYSTKVGATNAVNKAELQLMAKLFPKSEVFMKDVLPVKDKNSSVKVKLQIAIRQIMDIHEKTQVVILSVWIRQYWNNPMLTWKGSDYMNITSINVDRNLVWVPDMCLYNTADNTGSLYQSLDTKVIVTSDGNCTWLAPIILKSECKIDVEFFPFDEQSCVLQFGSWTYSSVSIDVNTTDTEADLSNFITNGEWDIIDVKARRHEDFYPCCDEPYPSIIFTVRVRRRMLYYVSNLIIPCAVIAALAFLSFYLPVDSGERISLVITVLLAMTVYMLMVSNSMPPTSEVIPLIGKYYLAVMIEIALCLVATCVTIRWHHNDTPMPRWLHSLVVRCFGKIFCANGSEVSYVETHSSTSYNVNNNRMTAEYPQATTNTNTVQLQEITSNPKTDMESIHKDLSVLSKKAENDETEEGIRHDWKKAALVLDRLFFVVFLLTFILFSLVILTAIPNYNS